MTLYKNLFIGAYLIIQLILPLRGCFYEKFETRGNFTWNMYSQIYMCWSQYRLDMPDGDIHWPVNAHNFNRPESSLMAFYSEFLPDYNRWH